MINDAHMLDRNARMIHLFIRSLSRIGETLTCTYIYLYVCTHECCFLDKGLRSSAMDFRNSPTCWSSVAGVGEARMTRCRESDISRSRRKSPSGMARRSGSS